MDKDFFPDDADLESDAGLANPKLFEIFDRIAELSHEEVVAVQVYLTGVLPPPDADKVDLSVEIATQLRDSKLIMSEALANKFIPINQKTAAMNAVNRAIAALVSMQASMYNIERVKTFEEAVMTTLKDHPDAAAIVSDFNATFERLMGDKLKSRAAQ